MEREIIFRGKRLDGGGWAYGDLIQNKDLGECCILAPEDHGGYSEAEKGFFVRQVDPSTVGQYTGLTDRNGVKIFEGDYLQTKYGRICEVVWHQPSARWDMNAVAKIDLKAPLFLECWRPENNKVIGNRWDNPELLEVKK